MRRRIVGVLLAALAMTVVSWFVVGYDADAEGFHARFVPSLWIGASVVVMGMVFLGFTLLREHLGARERSPRPASAFGSRARAFALAALVPLLVLLPFVASGRWTGLVLETLVYVTIAVGLNIAVGMAGLLVLGHAAFWAIGAYTFAMLTVHLHWNFWLALPAAGVAAALAGLVVGLPALRLRGDYLAIVTLGFGEAVRLVIENESRWTGGLRGIPGPAVPELRDPDTGVKLNQLKTSFGPLGEVLWQPKDRLGCYFFALGLAVVCVACVMLLQRSRHGRALMALREDETAAQCMGISTVRIKLVAFMSAAFWAGLAGVVHPVYNASAQPKLYDFTASVLFVSMVVLGGLGSVAGSVLGAALIFLLPHLLRNWVPDAQDYRMLVFGAVMAAMMVVRPEGLLGRPGQSAAAEEEEPPTTREDAEGPGVPREATS